MDLKQLRAFLTVVDTGNITRAAAVLHLVQPAVTRQIQLLEADLGARLFLRERQGMVPTPAGQALVAYARRALLELDRARAEVAGSRAGVGGLVVLGLLPSTIEVLSSPLATAVANQYPGIRLRIAMGYAGTLQAWLRSGEVDAALLYGLEQRPDIATTPLIEEPLWVVGPPQASFRRRRPVALAALRGRPLVLPSAPHGIRSLVDEACAAIDLEPRICAETNALSVQRSLVLGGHGLTILPPIAVAEDLRLGRLSGAPLSDPVILRTLVLAVPGNRTVGEHVHRTVDLLVDCARRAVGEGRWTEGRWLGRPPSRVGSRRPRTGVGR